MIIQNTLQEKSHEKIKNFKSRKLAIVNYLVGIQNNKKEIRPSQERICKDLKISRSSLNRDLNEIEHEGVFHREKTPFGNTTIYHLADYFLDIKIRKILAPFLKALNHTPFAALSLALLMSFFPLVNGAVDRDGTLLRISYKDIKNKSLCYCKMVPSLRQLRYRDWLYLQQFEDEFLSECINDNKKNIAKAKNPFAYLMGICRQRAHCFDIEPDITKAKWLIASDLSSEALAKEDVLRGNPASHVETQKTKTPKKGTSQAKYKKKPFKQYWLGPEFTQDRMAMQKEKKMDEALKLEKEIAWHRAGISPAVPEKPIVYKQRDKVLENIAQHIETPSAIKARALFGDAVYFEIMKKSLSAKDVINGD
jgi:hypothetical protein